MIFISLYSYIIFSVCCVDLIQVLLLKHRKKDGSVVFGTKEVAESCLTLFILFCSMILLPLLGYHLRLISQNKTTFEDLKKIEPDPRFPSKGFCSNLFRILFSQLTTSQIPCSMSEIISEKEYLSVIFQK